VKLPKQNETHCKKNKCPDYFADDGEPAWCFRAGQPVQVAAAKCPQATDSNDKLGEMMKKWKILAVCLSVVLFPGSLPYEPVYTIELPCHPFRCASDESKAPLIPPRRRVPEAYRPLFDDAALSVGIPPGVLESIAFVESGFNPAAMSPQRESGHRDVGMFQFNSAYLSWYAETYNAGIAFDPLSPGEAITVAAKHVRFLYGRYGRWPTVCLAYNAGMTAVDNDAIPDCSIRYLLKIYANF
jgi:hypothetical protein